MMTANMVTGAPALHAQQKTVHHLLVSFYENYSITGGKTLIETREDGSQTKKDIEMRQAIGLGIALSSYYIVTRFFLRKEE